MKHVFCLILIFLLAVNPIFAGLTFVRSSGITFTGADGITFTGADGITFTGADGFSLLRSNGITLTGADGITLTGADGITFTGADASSYAGPNGITLTGADGITLTGADGITFTGADGITLTGADGTQYRADSIIIRQGNGITLTGADGITFTGADGITLTRADGAARRSLNGITFTGADGITLTGADGITFTGADGITLTGADTVLGVGINGVLFDLRSLSGITLTGADGITFTGADGVNITRPRGITLTGADGITFTGADTAAGIESIDPELAIALNNATDDSNINAVIIYHRSVTEQDLADLRSIGIFGGTRFRKLPMIYVTGTRNQIAAISRFSSVRSIYGNRTLSLNIDPYFERTRAQKVSSDSDLKLANSGLPISGRGVAVAVLDTGINASHPDLAGKVVQNVKLADIQSAPVGFLNPQPIEGQINTDTGGGHGTFVAGIIAASGASSSGKFRGISSGSNLLGLAAGDLSLIHVLAGFDYLLDKSGLYNVRVVNCSFSADTVFDPNDPVNIATKMLADNGIVTVFSAGNSGPGDGTLNPYALAPWVISVGATDENGRLAPFSSRGKFGDVLAHPTVVAPGVNVASLRAPATATGTTGFGAADSQRLSASELPYYTTASGTSFSAPQVAAAAALMLEANPRLKTSEIKEIISRTATPLPKYFYHEAGAGLLNTYAAVLKAAFPSRPFGAFRATTPKNSVRFSSSVLAAFELPVYPSTAAVKQISLPPNTLRATFTASWPLGTNDFGLRILRSDSTAAGASNNLNLPGITGRSERVVLRQPASDAYGFQVYHSGGIGYTQNVSGLVEITSVEYPRLMDLQALSADVSKEIKQGLLMNLVLSEGSRFKANFPTTRLVFAESLVRSGLATQYVAGTPMFSDVRDKYGRSIAESVQISPEGPFFFDAESGGRFRPFDPMSRLAAAVAFVRAAGLESRVAGAVLPLSVSDAASIPQSLRGYVAVALQSGFLALDGDKFSGSRPITRLETVRGLLAILNLES
ncbi:MAG: hypothetical protein C4324_03225 [Blastocatellia bacterium]